MSDPAPFFPDRAALSRAVTVVESARPDHQTQAAELLAATMPWAGRSVRIGITGVPGVGKSTLIEALGLWLVSQGRRLAVLAVDPTSATTKGSILGDKSRMPLLSVHERAFVRPSPTSGALGGVAHATREAIQVCEAAGYDTVFVETVGVGQSETAVHGLVDCFLLLALPGAGDELQGIKRGVMELADVFAVTKADGDNVPAAKRASAQVSAALRLFAPPPSGWKPSVLLVSALEGSGIQELWSEVEAFIENARSTGWFERRRADQAVEAFHRLVQYRALAELQSAAGWREAVAHLEAAVRAGTLTSRAALEELFKKP